MKLSLLGPEVCASLRFETKLRIKTKKLSGLLFRRAILER